MTMRDRKRVQEDIERIYNRFGLQPFRWMDVKDIAQNSPIYFAQSAALKCVGKQGGCKIYKINEVFFDREKSPYKLKKSPLYPKKIWEQKVVA